MSYQKNERSGEIFALGHAAFYASMPLFIVLSSGVIPPLFFAGASFLLAGIFLLPIAWMSERDRFFSARAGILPFCIGAGLIVLVNYPLIIYAGQKTSAGNIAILSQTEVFFTFLFFGVLGTELINKQRVAGGICIAVGTLVVLMRDFSGTFVVWDLIIILAATIAPYANHYQKIALKYMGSISMVVWRNILAGIILCIVGLVFEPISLGDLTVLQIGLIAFNAILAFGIGKWFLFIAYKKIGVTKSIAINGTSPAITLLLAFMFLKDVPTLDQVFGLMVISLGVYLIMMRQTTVFIGKVVTGDKIGTTIGFPTINVKTTAKIPSGVYVARINIGGKVYPAVMHVGQRPTLKSKEFRIELHVLERLEQEISKTVEVEIVQHLRAVKKFRSIAKLQEQIAKDVKSAKEILQTN